MKKKYHNNGQGSDNILQNYFTAYVEKSLINNRITYIQKQARLEECDLVGDIDDTFDEGHLLPDLTETMYEEMYASEMDMIENFTLLSALRRLDEKDRMIVKLHIIYERSYKEIACIMGMTLTAVRSRYNRAIQMIRERMEDGCGEYYLSVGAE